MWNEVEWYPQPKGFEGGELSLAHGEQTLAPKKQFNPLRGAGVAPLHPNKVTAVTPQMFNQTAVTDGDRALRLLLLYPDLFRAATLNLMPPNGCIMVTRVLHYILSSYGVISWPMVVRVWVSNRAYIGLYDRYGRHPQESEYRAWFDTGALRVGCGWSEDGSGLGEFRGGSWVGHLVLYAMDSAGAAFMLDYTADQVTHKERGIVMKPTLVRLNNDAIAGNPYSIVHPEFGACYTPFPDDNTYEASHDWQQIDHPLNKALVAAVQGLLTTYAGMVK